MDICPNISSQVVTRICHKFTYYVCVCHFHVLSQRGPPTHTHTYSCKIHPYEFTHTLMYIRMCPPARIYGHTRIHEALTHLSYTQCSFRAVHPAPRTPIEARTPAPTQFSVHLLAPALHDDFSRCLSPGLRPRLRMEGVPGGDSCPLPGRRRAGEVEPSSLGSGEVRS